MHGTWLLSAVADSWILAEQCLATGEFSAMGKSTAVALVRMSVMIADQIDDASVLMSWSPPAGLSEVNTDSYFGKPEPRPPFDWDRAHLAPLFSEGWPEDWQEAQIQLAIASAGNFLDRQIDQQYPKHGAVINSEKKTKGPRKMLYLNDLVESGILVKKCGATALSGIGKVAGFASNQYDRIRASWASLRSAVETGFPDFAAAGVGLFPSHLAVQESMRSLVFSRVGGTLRSPNVHRPKTGYQMQTKGIPPKRHPWIQVQDL